MDYRDDTVRLPRRVLPERGTRWTMNVGRRIYPQRQRQTRCRIVAVVAKPGTMSFHDRESFGELVFD